MKGSTILTPSTGLWRHKDNGMVIAWIYGDRGRLVWLSKDLARIWFQTDGVKTVDQIADVVNGMDTTAPRPSRDHIIHSLEELLQMGLVYKLGDVWADGRQ